MKKEKGSKLWGGPKRKGKKNDEDEVKLLYGDKTEDEMKNEQEEYENNNLNE